MAMLNRICPRGNKFFLIEDQPNKKTIIRLLGTEKKITVNMTIEAVSAAWYKWTMLGNLIQVAFPELDASEREFLMSGITPEEWARLFPNSDDDNNVIVFPRKNE